MKDLRKYSDNELSLIVFNDEGLYRLRKEHLFFGILDAFFLYTDKQHEVLIEDLDADRKES